MNFKTKRTMFEAPSPGARKQSVDNLRWWLFDQFGYEPHIPQIDFHISPARYRAIIAGTRGGKSRAAGEEAVPYLFAGATRVWIVGQSYALTEKEFRYVYERMTSKEVADLFGGVPPLERHTYNQKGGDMSLRTKWGAEVWCISLEKADIGAFGEECDLIILSESAQIKHPKQKWERILMGRLGSRLGDLIIPTTPAGRAPRHDPDGWLYDMYMKGFDPDFPDYFTRKWASWENPYWPEDPYELRRVLDPKIFAEQYGAEFMVFSGTVYSGFDERVHVIPPFDIPPHWRRYEAIDPGFSGKFAWLSAVISEQGNVFIVDEYSDQERLYQERVEEIRQHRAAQYGIHVTQWDRFCKKNGTQTVTVIDPEDPQCRAEFTSLGLPCVKADNNVEVGIDRVARRLKWSSTYSPSLYFMANCEEAIEAMKMHGWGEKTVAGGGVLQLRKPANDRWKHFCDTVRYICAGYLIPSEPKKEEEYTGEDALWGLLLELQAQQGKHPHTMDAYDRRSIVGGLN